MSLPSLLFVPRRGRKSMLFGTVLAAGLAFAPALGHAQSPVPLTLAEAQRVALQRSPALSSQALMAESAREMSLAAGELPDPQLFGGFENVPVTGPNRWRFRDGMTMTRIGIMQEVTRSEKRELRSERARREAERAEVAAQFDSVGIQRETASAWLGAYFAQRIEQAIAAQIAETELQATMADAAYRAGRGGQNDLLAARSAQVELRNRTIEAQLAARRARLALARYVGDAAQRPLAQPPALDALPQPVEQLLAVEAQPDVKRLDAQRALLDTEAELARAGKLPDWSVELSYGLREGNSDVISLMFRIALPVSPETRQDREQAAKLKERDAIAAMREDVKRMREAEVRQMLAEWEAMREQGRRIREELMPLARMRTEAALASYRGGMGSLAMVLEGRRGELDAEIALINAEQAAARSWAWLANLVPGSTP